MKTRRLPTNADERAPDGSEVRKLLRTDAASMTHFRLQAGDITTPVQHRSIEEQWYVVSGYGELRLGDERITLEAGVAIVIPPATPFRFAASSTLNIVGVATPPWPGDDDCRFLIVV